MGSHIPALKSRPSAVNRLRGFLLRLQALTPRDKLVAVALLQSLNMRKDCECAVRQATLAERLGVSVRTIARALSALKAAGILRWRRRRRRSSEYRWNFRVVDDKVTAPDGIDRPYRQGGAPLIVRKAVAAVVAVALDVERDPRVMPRLSAGALLTRAGRP